MYTMYVILDKNYIDKVGAKFKRKVLMITRHSISITGAKKIVNEVQQRGSPTSYLITDGETGVVLIIKPSS